MVVVHPDNQLQMWALPCAALRCTVLPCPDPTCPMLPCPALPMPCQVCALPYPGLCEFLLHLHPLSMSTSRFIGL